MHRMYVLLRKDLDETYRCVQAGHALAQYSLDYPDLFKKWNNTDLIYLGVRNLKELREWTLKIKSPFSLFREPDLDGQETALAYYGPGLFKGLDLA